MDQTMQNDRVNQILNNLHLSGLLLYNFTIACLIVEYTVELRVYKEIILLEGILFAIAYFLKSLDRLGGFLILTGHILSIIPTYTEFRIVSAIVKCIFMTLYPTYMIYESSLFVARYLVVHEQHVPFLRYLDFPEGLHVFASISQIIYHYYHLRQKGVEDIIIGIMVFRIAYFVPDLHHVELVLTMTFSILWMIIKAERFPKISEFPRRVYSVYNDNY